MEVAQAIRGRRAVREYTDAPVDEVTLQRLIEAAVQAPSAVNEQPWLFSVIRDRALLDRLSSAAKAHLLAHASPGAGGHLEELRDNPGFDIFHHAPALIVIASRTPGHWGVVDCALAAENLMLAARDAGLGSCWIGFAEEWLNTPEGKAAIGVPPEARVVAPIIAGHPVAFPPPVPREMPHVHWIG